MEGQGQPMRARADGPLRGTAEVPGDKSISHRALILGALAVGETRISGLLEGADVLDTGRAMRAFGALVEQTGAGEWRVQGVGVGGFREPEDVIEPSPRIRFLGLWDVVAAFGLANLGNTALNIGHHLSIPRANLDYCFHAMALDERRPSFLPIRLNGAYEVWFRGVHSDVGGGNDNHALNDITLRWMLHKAIASGLPMKADCVAASCTRANVEGKVSDNFDPIRNRAREPKADDRFHYTVSARARHVNPPDPCTRETEILETKPWVPA